MLADLPSRDWPGSLPHGDEDAPAVRLRSLVRLGRGPGETVGSGQTDPDEYTVFKPGLKDPGLNPVIDVRIGAKRRKAVCGEDRMVPAGIRPAHAREPSAE
ncbi:hypothetical protein [Streptomyces sp. NBC_01276]|uniref:hypothetical protein n=1 Tax=Streptomyces sp. NBC_01276 TaxID=2903808 RepID=UPI00352F18A7